MIRQKTIFVLIVLAAITLVAASCHKEESDDDNKFVVPMPDPNDVYTPPAESDDTVEDNVVHRAVDLTLETRNTASLKWTEIEDEITDAEITPGSEYGYGNDAIAADVKLKGGGEILRFPEARFLIHTIYFTAPAFPGGPGDTKKIQYALTLTGQEGSTERQGGISVYCGDTITGKPARILRIVGAFKRP
jgi:hypothetical protein